MKKTESHICLFIWRYVFSPYLALRTIGNRLPSDNPTGCKNPNSELLGRRIVIVDENILPHLIGRIVVNESLKSLVCQGVFPVAVIMASDTGDDVFSYA